MPVLTLPSAPRFTDSEFRLITKTRVFESSEDGSGQTKLKPGAKWLLEAVLPIMTRAQAALWTAFLAELDGPAGRFYGGDPFALTPLGVATGTPLVNGASQTGTSLITDGWTGSITGIMVKGDYFAVDLPSGGGARSLHQMTADANTDGPGNATLVFRPALRESPANNATIITASATCVMQLIDYDQARWAIGADGLYSIAFTAIESFNLGA